MADKPKKGKLKELTAQKKAAASVALQKSKKKPFYQEYKFQLYMLWIIMTCLLSLFTVPSLRIKISSIEAGDISSRNIKAPWDFSVEDQETTIERQNAAEKSVLPVYDYNNTLRSELVEKIHGMFEYMRGFYLEKNPGSFMKDTNISTLDQDKRKASSPAEQAQSSDIEKDLEKNWEDEWRKYAQLNGIDIDYSVYLIFEDRNFDPNVENVMIQSLNEVMKKGIIASYSFSFNEREQGLVWRNVSTQTETKVKDVTQILDLEGARKLIKAKMSNLLPGDEQFINAVTAILQNYISPNLSFNLSETRIRMELARESVKPAFFQIKKGEMIIREGERAKPDQVEKLNALKEMKKSEQLGQNILGLIFIVGLTLMILFILLKKFRPKYILSLRNLLLIALSILVTMFLIRIGVFIAYGLHSTIPIIPTNSYYFVFPFALAALIVAILLDVEIAVMVAAIVAILAGILLNRDLGFFILAFLGSLGGIYSLSTRVNRGSVVRAGFVVGLVNVGVVIPLSLIQGTFFTLTGVFNLLFGFIGGISVMAFVLAIMPLMEAIFQVTTDVRLLELLNLNQPLLRRLAIDAPGTYHHCIVVANLAEAACEAINANSLMARVAAYYHDIGKIKMPRYYIENQMNYKNEHEKLSPSMSSLILSSHVKDGVELGKKYKLNKPIIDIIQQHHGTALIKYFYAKAKEIKAKDGKEAKEEDYRYPGPKPQTKEAGIVMLADAVEATSRTLTDPRPSRIQGMIQNTINNIFRDGQLNECEITLKDLHQIAGSFNLILAGIFHPRIVYPGTSVSEEQKKEKSGDIYSKSSKETKVGNPADEEAGGEDIRRLGIANPGSEHNIRK
ncbi:MAG: HD family phosphohydrolase [bacterium]